MKISMIIPAAGMSRRYPPNKLMERFDNETVIEKTLKIFQGQNFEIILVAGYESDRLKEVVSKQFGDTIQVIKNTSYKKGLSESIKTGIRAVGPDKDYFGFSLGDKPFILRKTVRFLSKKLETSHPEILVPTYEGKNGHPIFFSQEFRHDLLNITGDTGGRGLIGAYESKVKFIPVKDRGIILDMDAYHNEENRP